MSEVYKHRVGLQSKLRAMEHYVSKGYYVFDETNQGPIDFDIAIVPAGEYHQFHAHKPTEAYEIYWPQEISFSDIIRENVGGI